MGIKAELMVRLPLFSLVKGYGLRFMLVVSKSLEIKKED